MLTLDFWVFFWCKSYRYNVETSKAVCVTVLLLLIVIAREHAVLANGNLSAAHVNVTLVIAFITLQQVEECSSYLTPGSATAKV